MAGVAQPGLGLIAGWTDGEPGWGEDMNANLFMLSVVVQARVFSKSQPLPVSPSFGDAHIVPSGDEESLIGVFDGSDWRYFVPTAGFEVYVVDEARFVYWDGLEWRPRPLGNTSVQTKIANYALEVSDFNGDRVIVMDTSGGDLTVTIPGGLVVTEPVTVIRGGPGRVLFAPGTGVSLDSADNIYSLRTVWSAAQVTPLGPGAFVLVGDLGV